MSKSKRPTTTKIKRPKLPKKLIAVIIIISLFFLIDNPTILPDPLQPFFTPIQQAFAGPLLELSPPPILHAFIAKIQTLFPQGQVLGQEEIHLDQILKTFQSQIEDLSPKQAASIKRSFCADLIEEALQVCTAKISP